MSIIIQAIVALLTSLLPLIEKAGASAIVDKIITTLISIIPTAVQFAEDLVPEIQNIITALKGGTVTPAQFTQLVAAEALIDSSFDAAAKAAGDPGAV